MSSSATPAAVAAAAPVTAATSTKRARAGTATAKSSDAITLPTLADTDLSVEMELELDTAEERAHIQFGGPAATAIPWDVNLLTAMCKYVAEQAEGDLPYQSTVMTRCYTMHEEDQTAAVSALYKIFDKGTAPIRYIYDAGIDASAIWTRRGPAASVLQKTPMLPGKLTTTWRAVENRTFVIVSHIEASWPPPIGCGPNSSDSTLWKVRVNAEYPLEALGVLVRTLGTVYTGFFSPSVRDPLLSGFSTSNTTPS